jgi:hypothetical protein
METDEATIGCKEEIGIRTVQTGKGVEGSAVHSNENGRGEARLWEELDPMNIVVIGHDSLNYPSPLHSLAPLYLRDDYGSVTIETLTNDGARKMKGRTGDPRIPAERSRDASDSSPTR